MSSPPSPDRTNTSSTNPFDDDSVQSLPNTGRSNAIMKRGELIQGVRSKVSPNGRESSAIPSSDIEALSEAPDSDYASHVPRSVWEEHDDPSDIRVQATGNLKPKQRTKVWATLCIVSILLVGAVIAVAVLVFGKGSDRGVSGPNFTARQQLIDVLVRNVTEPMVLSNEESPQAKALEWLLYKDTLWVHLDEDEDLVDPLVNQARITQRYALVVFFYSTGGESWEESTWLLGDECDPGAQWTGVVCIDNLVHTLALDRMGLVGTLPSEIALLSNMENFMLKNHPSLEGEITSALGRLPQLRQLGLYYSKLSGPIPSDLFQATNLEYINFQDNGITGTIPSEIGLLRNLNTLVLMDNELSGQIPFERMAFTQLKFLGLSFNNLSGSISDSIGLYSQLQYMYLDHNQMTGAIPDPLGQSGKLKSLNLGHNSFAGTIPVSLGKLGDLEYLSLQSNSISGFLPSSLANMRSLTTVNIASNEISGVLPDISELDWLRSLVLAQNKLDGSIPESYTLLRSLDVLFLSSNKLTGTIPDFSRAQSLTGLYLSDNQLTGVIPESLCRAEKLEALFLDENQLHGTIPSCLGLLQDLEQLYLFQNSLSGQVPHELGFIRKLTGIGLEANNLSGDGPNAICDNAEANDLIIDFWSDCDEGVGKSSTCSCCNVCCPSADCN